MLTLIIYIVIIFTLLTLFSWFLIKPKLLRVVLGTISSALLLLSSLSIVANTAYHFGMEEKTVVNTAEIYTAGQKESPVNLLIANQIGTQSGNYAMNFRDSQDSQDPTTHFVPDQSHMAESVKKSATYKIVDEQTSAKLITTTTKWQFSSDFYKTLFKVEDSDSELISEKNEITVPKSNWLVLSADQAKSLAEKQQAMTDEQKQAQQTQLKQEVAKQVQTYQAQNPGANQQQLAEYTQQVSTQLTLQMMNSLIN
ncbi:hypothetical protein FC86_GL000924 [Holzapfeliella floricola DSM 23037 = JCM 16512]|uniref:DUF4811 domain-containing protein n=1 Tax=Holzapfeliella floricola DSM 23037 = JCM 16512 TaxID=1423744 RepID=A0A0R2DUQ5_9LACO|nr:hypothetical protein FC86_GL000924 [Holzapfeliella floricola DSM 23037 = JCM 16512]